MKYCAHCGKEIMDEAVICPGCGCPVNQAVEPVPMETPKNMKQKPKVKKIWIILSTVVLALGIIAAVLFVPRNLKMDDFEQTNVVTAIIKYGWPESIRSDEDGLRLLYGDKVDFYGITPYAFTVYPESDEVAFFFNGDDAYDVYSKIKRYCDFEENLLNMFHKFSYDNLYITTYDYDGGYVRIEID